MAEELSEGLAMEIDFTKIFPDVEGYQRVFERAERMMGTIKPMTAEELDDGEQAEALLCCLQYVEFVRRHVMEVYTYGVLRSRLNVSGEGERVMREQTLALKRRFEEAVAFLRPALTDLGEERLEELIGAERFDQVRMILRDALEKGGMTQEEQEQVAGLTERLNALRTAFEADLGNSNLGEITVGEETVPVTRRIVGRMLFSDDSSDRRRGYEAYYGGVGRGAEGLTEYLAEAVAVSSLRASVRLPGYQKGKPGENLRDYLRQQSLPEGLYDNLVATTRSNAPLLRRFLAVRARLLGMQPEQLQASDMVKTVFKQAALNLAPHEMVELIDEALAPLGEEYAEQFAQASESERVDWRNGDGKSFIDFITGFYGKGTFASVNSRGDFKSLSLAAHEVGGHAVHYLLAMNEQPFTHYKFTTLISEVAARVAERLLMDHMIEREEDADTRRAMVAYSTNLIDKNFWRQAGLADFEMQLHAAGEVGEDLTKDRVAEIYQGMLEDYYGDHLDSESASRYAWTSNPQLFEPFYLGAYPLATAIAHTIVDRIKGEGGEEFAAKYVEMLKKGGSEYPQELLAGIGIDLNGDVYSSLFKRFESLLDELEAA